jgi:nicotinamide-nucleotide adenylyltransferase
MTETGVIHGRFQVLHNDHLRYLLAGKARCRYLVVGITNPDPTLTKVDSADPQRSDPMSNPLNYYERYLMVQAALMEAGLSSADFAVVPFPINLPELYCYYVPLDATFYLTIYDEWGRKKLRQFQTLGLKTEVLWERPLSEKGLSAAEIRSKMADGDPWDELVPRSARSLLRKWGIPNRIQNLSQTLA